MSAALWPLPMKQHNFRPGVGSSSLAGIRCHPPAPAGHTPPQPTIRSGGQVLESDLLQTHRLHDPEISGQLSCNIVESDHLDDPSAISGQRSNVCIGGTKVLEITIEC